MSFVEGIQPLEGVVITKAQPVQSIAPGAVFKDCDDCPEMVVIPAGQFVMGASPGEEERENLHKDFRDQSQPQHRVEVRRFAAGKFSVTREQYEVFVNATGRKSDGCSVWTGIEWENDLGKDWRNPGFLQDERHPVACVSWDDAIAYVQWLSQKTGKSYRLLSEAEWEYAARGGSTTAYPWGKSRDNFDAFAWHNQVKLTQQVGLKKPNQFGLNDMIGNVWEWTQDCWNGNYIGAPTDGSAWASGDCSQRVLRGSGIYLSNGLSTTQRVSFKAASSYKGYGFRVAKDL